MDNWENISEYVALVVFMVLVLYITGHMIYNRIKGQDELENLFVFKRKRNKNNT
jgi:hypothetical protein